MYPRLYEVARFHERFVGSGGFIDFGSVATLNATQKDSHAHFHANEPHMGPHLQLVDQLRNSNLADRLAACRLGRGKGHVLSSRDARLLGIGC